MTQESVRIADDLIKAFNSHDPQRASDLFTESATVYMAVATPPFAGREQIAVGFFSPIMNGWPDCRWTKKLAFAQGDFVYMQFNFNGSSSKYPDLPIETWDCAVLKIQDGEIAEGHFYYDTGSIGKQREAQGVS